MNRCTLHSFSSRLIFSVTAVSIGYALTEKRNSKERTAFRALTVMQVLRKRMKTNLPAKFFERREPQPAISSLKRLFRVQCSTFQFWEKQEIGNDASKQLFRNPIQSRMASNQYSPFGVRRHESISLFLFLPWLTVKEIQS